MAEKIEKRDVWDEHLRGELYTILVYEFGPLRSWEAKSRPFRSGGAFQEFLSKAAEHFNRLHDHDLSPDSIKSQINYVLQRPRGAEYNVEHSDNFKRNIKAAVTAHFISLEDLKKRLGGGGGGGDGRPDREARDRQRQMQRGRKRQAHREQPSK